MSRTKFTAVLIVAALACSPVKGQEKGTQGETSMFVQTHQSVVMMSKLLNDDYSVLAADWVRLFVSRHVHSHYVFRSRLDLSDLKIRCNLATHATLELLTT